MNARPHVAFSTFCGYYIEVDLREGGSIRRNEESRGRAAPSRDGSADNHAIHDVGLPEPSLQFTRSPVDVDLTGERGLRQKASRG